MIEWVAILVELGILVLLAFRVRRLVSSYRAQRSRHAYAIDALREALADTVGPRLGGLMFTELAVTWYAFAGWGKARTRHPMGTVHPGYRHAGYPAILGAVIMAVVVETAAVHFLLGLWIGAWVWILTFLGAYSIVWLVGDFNAARQCPSLVTEDAMLIRTGLRWRAEVPLRTITALHASAPEGDALAVTLFGKPNRWIECGEDITVHGPFGIRRTARVIGLGLDDPGSISLPGDTSVDSPSPTPPAPDPRPAGAPSRKPPS